MSSAMESLELSRIQRWMQSVITDPNGVREGMASPAARQALDVSCEQVENVICRSNALTGVERLAIYANAYYGRLLQVLGSEYPASVFALGEKLFKQFATGYLQEHPSRSYTLSELGACFPSYLAKTRPPRETAEPDWADFLIDLATLERTYNEVFDGPGSEGRRTLQTDALEGMKPADFQRSRFAAVPCLKLLTFRFAVHEYASAVRRREAPEFPRPLPTWLVVTRRDHVVRRVSVSEAEFAVLAVLVAGGTVAESLQAAQTQWTEDAAKLASAIRRWFREWSAAGYFQGILPEA